MTLNARLQREVQRLGLIFAGTYFLIVAALAMIFIYGHHQDQFRLANSYSRAAKDSLVALDLRQALLSLNPALQDDFRAVGIRDQHGVLRAGLPRESIVEAAHGPFDVRIRIPLTVGENAETIAILDFHYSLFSPVLSVALAALLISIAVVLLFRRSLRGLERRHRAELENQRTELVAWMAMQVSHDIKSPLAVLQTVARDTEGLPSEERKIILNAAQRISDITFDLLHKSKGLELQAPARTGNVPTSEIELSQLVQALGDEKRTEHQHNPLIRIETHIPPGLNLRSRLAPKDLSRILSNLMNNAVQALGEGGGTVKLIAREQSAHLSVQVSDNGQGMTEEVLARVKTGSSSGFSTKGGHGLGLSHAHRELSQAGGRLDIISTPGAGTIVTVILPKG